MIKGLNGDALAAALALGVLAGLLWHHEHHFTRVMCWLFAASAGFLVVAIPVWQGALGGLLLTGGGITAIVVACLVVFPTFHLAAIRSSRPSRMGRFLRKGKGGGGEVAVRAAGGPPKRNRFHRVSTPVFSILTGTLVVVVFGGWRLIAAAAGKSAAGAGRALLQSTSQIGSGHAAATVPASHRPSVLIAGAFVLLLIIAFMRGIEKRKHGRGGNRGGAGNRGASPGLPAGRSA